MLLYLLSNKWNNENIFHFTSLEYFLSFKKAEIWAALLFFCKSSIRNNRAIFISCCFYSVGDQSWLVYFHRHKIIKNIIHSDDKYYAISYHLTSQSLFLLFVQEYKKRKCLSFYFWLRQIFLSFRWKRFLYVPVHLNWYQAERCSWKRFDENCQTKKAMKITHQYHPQEKYFTT